MAPCPTYWAGSRQDLLGTLLNIMGRGLTMHGIVTMRFWVGRYVKKQWLLEYHSLMERELEVHVPQQAREHLPHWPCHPRQRGESQTRTQWTRMWCGPCCQRLPLQGSTRRSWTLAMSGYWIPWSWSSPHRFQQLAPEKTSMWNLAAIKVQNSSSNQDGCRLNHS